MFRILAKTFFENMKIYRFNLINKETRGTPKGRQFKVPVVIAMSELKY